VTEPVGGLPAGLPGLRKSTQAALGEALVRLVQSFAPETLFYTLKEIGVADAGDPLRLGQHAGRQLGYDPRSAEHHDGGNG